jgi:hypothetical protein
LLSEKPVAAGQGGSRFMQFVNSRPDVVRSINQRWLLSLWNKLRASAPVPFWKNVQTSEFATLSADLALLEVVASESETRFLVRFRGQRIANAFGPAGQGKFLDEVLPPLYRDDALETYRQVLVTLLPVYTITDMRDRDGRIVHFERLLLPFSRDGVAIDRILTSIEAVSPEGAFENRGILQSAPRRPAFALCATIQH